MTLPLSSNYNPCIRFSDSDAEGIDEIADFWGVVQISDLAPAK